MNKLVICKAKTEQCKTIDNGLPCSHCEPHTWHVMEKYSIAGCTHEDLLCPYIKRKLVNCIPYNKKGIK